MERNNGITLLKCILPIMVIILHFNNSHGGAGLIASSGNPIEHEFLLLLEALSIAAVNVFVMISGYFLSFRNKRNLNKILFLFVQLILINLGYYAIRAVISGSFSFHGLLLTILPSDYFIWLYSCCYIVSLWINLVIDNVNKKQFEVLLLLFSAWPTIADGYTNITGNSLMGMSMISNTGNDAGYTIVQFVLDYLLGAYLARYPINNTKKTAVGIAVCSLAVWGLEHISFSYAIEYCNLFVVLNSFYILALFSKLKTNSNTLLEWVSNKTLLLYLFHTKLYFLWRNKFALSASEGTLTGILHILVLIAVMYFCTLLLADVFQKVFGYFASWMQRKYPAVLSLNGINRNQEA